MDVITKNVSVQGGNRLLKLSLKQGEYLNIGDNIRVVYAGGAGNHIRLLVDAPRDVNIARNKTETNPERRKDTYYAEPGISREAQAENKKRCRKDERVVFASHNHLVIGRAKPGTPCLL